VLQLVGPGTRGGFFRALSTMSTVCVPRTAMRVFSVGNTPP
jgi:hypothetical protein